MDMVRISAAVAANTGYPMSLQLEKARNRAIELCDVENGDAFTGARHWRLEEIDGEKVPTAVEEVEAYDS